MKKEAMKKDMKKGADKVRFVAKNSMENMKEEKMEKMGMKKKSKK